MLRKLLKYFLFYFDINNNFIMLYYHWVIIMKGFKSKRKKKNVKQWPLTVFFFIFSYAFMVMFLRTKKLTNNIIPTDYNWHMITHPVNYVNDAINNVVSNPINFLMPKVKKVNMPKKSDVNINKTPKLIEPVNKENNQFLPVLYLYNTHQQEDYYEYGVYDATKKLSENLDKKGIKNIFEMQSISTFLQTNNLKYYKSYEASRNYLTLAVKNYPSLNYFVDIHRDSVSKNKSTLNYDGKNFAKVLFIVGTENINHSFNYDTTSKINEMLKNMVPGISRGIMQKGGKGVNGVYNQDISKNSILIEVGGKENTKEEVDNTMALIENVLERLIKGEL